MNAFTIRINDNLTIEAQESSDPNYPGVYITAHATTKGGRKVEVATALLELDEGVIKGRLWEYENISNDPIAVHELFDPENFEE